MLDSAEVSAMLDMLVFNSCFVGFCIGLIFPKFIKLINFSCEFFAKKLGKDKKKKEKTDEK